MTVTITTMFYRVHFSYRKHISRTNWNKVKIIKEYVDIRYNRVNDNPVDESEVLEIAHHEVDKYLCYQKSNLLSIVYLGCEKKEYAV